MSALPASLPALALAFVGGGLGSALRYLLGLLGAQLLGQPSPWMTWGINLLGSLALGYLLGLSDRTLGSCPELRILLGAGFCGGFTTFSTFSAEALGLLRSAAYLEAALYILLSVALGLGASLLGLRLAQG
ncbi:MAG: fluoride efflux transporter CrcB [Porphyromonadaceae bacterium]|nr:fluoride efflux transporter CrcB [Porphyromonadaceae bacterium]